MIWVVRGLGKRFLRFWGTGDRVRVFCFRGGVGCKVKTSGAFGLVCIC